MQARSACKQASVRMQDVGGIPPGLQRFCYGGKNLEDPQRTLEQYVGNCRTCPRISCMTHESDMIYRLNMMQIFMLNVMQVWCRLLAVQIPPMAPEDPTMCAPLSKLATGVLAIFKSLFPDPILHGNVANN